MKSNALSRWIASFGSLTWPRMLRDATVNGEKVTLLDPCAATSAASDWIDWPSTTSVN